MGDRSDVQCRYHYMQIKNGYLVGDDEIEKDLPIETTSVVNSAPVASSEQKKDEKMTAGHEERLEERIGLEIGSMSTSEIFWMLYR